MHFCWFAVAALFALHISSVACPGRVKAAFSWLQLSVKSATLFLFFSDLCPMMAPGYRLLLAKIVPAPPRVVIESQEGGAGLSGLSGAFTSGCFQVLLFWDSLVVKLASCRAGAHPC
ncbi:hypothetical protein Nepgr_031417 [Nepenthes gracilis]|uniref:Secreted protein n=1 Tax=Nepenthes gracilis TaxID=150966 RepID=A0AAD3TI31_NEPGR|nr:hypothetical protein Nepgr_031417 [Nepenthes gracilis]